MFRKGQIKILLLAFLGLLFWAKPSLASVRCETQYGGGETCTETEDIVIDKKVWDSDKDSFEDNLTDVTPEGKKFVLGERVIYRLKFKNVSDRKFDKVTIVDTLPTAYLKFDRCSDGAKFEYLNGEVAKVIFDIYDFESGEEDEKQIELLVKAVPAEGTFNCKDIVNWAEIWAEDQYDKDTARICVSNRGNVLGITTLPKTGSPVQFLLILTSIFAGLTGLIIVRLNRKP